MSCAICETRRPRRFCPGVRGDVCSLCCGTEREVSVECPLDCEYLQDAHDHERFESPDPATFPNADIRVSDEFLAHNEALAAFAGGTLVAAALEVPGVVDTDVGEALEALVRTYRTLESGIYFETRPANPLAAHLCARLQSGLEQFRRTERERGVARTRDADVLGVLVFFQHLELDRRNGRRRGRAFLDFARRVFAPLPGTAPARPSPLIMP